MADEKKLTLDEAHGAFAMEYNGKVWELLEKEDRTSEDDMRMLHLAHASCTHWLSAGTEVHHQRGEWMISRVNAVLGYSEAALRHAKKCLELAEDNPEKMEDFDRAFAFEAVARAYAIGNDRDMALKFIKKAETAGKAIKGKEDREIFEGDFNGGNWNGLR